MELEINGAKYRSATMDTFVSFHVARRLMPAYYALGAGAVKAFTDGAQDGLPVTALGPLIDVMATMKNDDTQFVIDSCLAVVSRQSGDRWQRVTAENGKLMFEDIKLPAMLQLVIAVVKENVLDFFQDAQTDQSETATASAPN